MTTPSEKEALRSPLTDEMCRDIRKYALQGHMTFSTDVLRLLNMLDAKDTKLAQYVEKMKEDDFALGRIDYLCGEPNEMECSAYGVLHFEPLLVVDKVATLLYKMRGYNGD
jgi:hypothetical protein